MPRRQSLAQRLHAHVLNLLSIHPQDTLRVRNHRQDHKPEPSHPQYLRVEMSAMQVSDREKVSNISILFINIKGEMRILSLTERNNEKGHFLTSAK